MFFIDKSRDKYSTGVEAKDIFTSEYLEIKDDSQDEKLKRLFLFIIEQTQEKIRLTDESNIDRISIFQNVSQTNYIR